MDRTLSRKRLGILGIVLGLVLMLVLAGCSSSTEGSASSSSSAAEGQTEETGLTILYEEDEGLINNYSLIAVNPDAPFVDADGNAVEGVSINTQGAKALIDWMLGPGLDLIANYGVDEYGESLFTIDDAAPHSTADIPQATEETATIRMSTTTSVNDSGLLEYLIPKFEEEYGYTVEIYSAGTGNAIANAEMGNADLILVHSKSQEEQFIADGFGYTVDGYDTERLTFMYNYFVLCGPADDPAGVREASSAADAFALIADGKYPFVSRGDASGTHTKEVSLWPEDLGITTDEASVADYTDWYTYSNAGMGACLTMADEMNAYILSDKATFLAFKANQA